MEAGRFIGIAPAFQGLLDGGTGRAVTSIRLHNVHDGGLTAAAMDAATRKALDRADGARFGGTVPHETEARGVPEDAWGWITPDGRCWWQTLADRVETDHNELVRRLHDRPPARNRYFGTIALPRSEYGLEALDLAVHRLGWLRWEAYSTFEGRHSHVNFTARDGLRMEDFRAWLAAAARPEWEVIYGTIGGRWAWALVAAFIARGAAALERGDYRWYRDRDYENDPRWERIPDEEVAEMLAGEGDNHEDVSSRPDGAGDGGGREGILGEVLGSRAQGSRVLQEEAGSAALRPDSAPQRRVRGQDVDFDPQGRNPGRTEGRHEDPSAADEASDVLEQKAWGWLSHTGRLFSAQLADRQGGWYDHERLAREIHAFYEARGMADGIFPPGAIPSETPFRPLLHRRGWVRWWGEVDRFGFSIGGDHAEAGARRVQALLRRYGNPCWTRVVCHVGYSESVMDAEHFKERGFPAPGPAGRGPAGETGDGTQGNLPGDGGARGTGRPGDHVDRGRAGGRGEPGSRSAVGEPGGGEPQGGRRPAGARFRPEDGE